MHLKNFTKQYRLHLLPAAHTRIILGNLVWKPFLGSPKHSHPGMPNHIGNALYDLGIINKSKWQHLLQNLDMAMCENAKLANIKIQQAHEVSASMLENIGLGFEHAYVLESSISKVCVKVMDNSMRVLLDNYLEQVSDNLLRALFRNPRKVYLITELYYGSVTLKVKKKHEMSFENRLVATQWPVHADLKGDKNHEYVFAHNEVPFAYKIERVKGFNG